MPNRVLRDGILTSARVNLLNWSEEVFYRRLMSIVDDYGRFHGDTELLRAYLYPLKVDLVKSSDILKWIVACVNADLIEHYKASDGKWYVSIVNFGQQLRASKSKFPQMIADDSIREQMKSSDSISGNSIADDSIREQMIADDSICTPSSEAESETETITVATSVAPVADARGAEPSATAKRRDLVRFDPDLGDWDWDSIPQSMADEWAKAYPAVKVQTEMRRAALWLTANPAKRKKDYNAFLVRWFSRAQEKGGTK